MVICWYLNPSMYNQPRPRKKLNQVYRPLHPWGVRIVNKMADYLSRHRGENVNAVLFYSNGEIVTPVWLDVVMSHDSLQPMLANAEKVILGTTTEVNESVREFHQHPGNTVLIVAADKLDLVQIRNGFGVSGIKLALNLIGPGGGGVRQRSHASKLSRDLWDTI